VGTKVPVTIVIQYRYIRYLVAPAPVKGIDGFVWAELFDIIFQQNSSFEILFLLCKGLVGEILTEVTEQNCVKMLKW